MTTSSDPRLGAIRLAWWRERLDDLDRRVAAPGEPRLQAVARELIPRGVTGQELSCLEDAWLPALEPFPWRGEQAAGFRLRGRILFGIGARLLGLPASVAESFGELWSLIDAAEHCSDDQSRALLLGEARSLDVPKPPRSLRPLTIIAAVAVESLRRPRGRLARGTAAALHRLTGRIPALN